jgi:1-acyl-sn-glycerol-3-phosphate acyltransferase
MPNHNQTRSPAAQARIGRNPWVYRITRIAAKCLLTPFFRVDVSGLENLPAESAFILLPKHQRWEDIPLLALATPRRLYYVAKHELFKNSLGSWYVTALGGIPLNRKRPLESRRSLTAIIEFLQKGEGVVVFPEGTYYRNVMGPGQIGMVKFILSRLSLPLIPVGIRYTRHNRRFWVRITFGKKFHAAVGVSVTAFIEHMMREIADLSGFSADIRI